MTATQPRRASRPAGPPTHRRALTTPATQPDTCQCPTGPIPVAHYINGDLHRLYRRHWGSRNGQPGCRLPNEPIDPHTYRNR